jgi:F-type H+-transporting ATPase subunit b
MLNLSWGLMVWTFITFGIAVYVLRRYAFGPIQKLIEDRRAAVQESMDAAEQTRHEAQRLLREYEQTLTKVRAEAEEILERSRATGDHAKAEILEEARAQADRVLSQAHEQIDRDTRAAVRDLKAQIAELTALATEKVTTRSLTPADQERLIEEALAELDLDQLGMGSKG